MFFVYIVVVAVADATVADATVADEDTVVAADTVVAVVDRVRMGFPSIVVETLLIVL